MNTLLSQTFLSFLAFLVAVPAANGDAPLATQSGLRNVLFLFADDQRADTIGAYNNPHIETPNIDRLVFEGFSFRNNYVFGSNNGAVCVPSRAMLMTGKAWTRFNTVNMGDEVLLPQLLRSRGYTTFATGKWHNGQPSWLRAFEVGKSIMFGGMSDHTKVPLSDLKPDGTLTETYTPDGFSTEIFADRAIEFLRNTSKDKPFFAYVAFTSPHDPRQPPKEYREKYYAKKPPLPKNFLPQHPFDNGMMNGGRDENLAPWPRTESVIRDQLAEYYGMMTHLDDQIGRILQTLRESGHEENTLVVYAADNGLAMGSHGLVGKQSLYEHSVRVPLILKGPGIPKNESSSSFTYLFDVFPTLCELLSVDTPKGLDGKSLVKIIRDPKKSVRDHVFLPFRDIQRSIRDDRWKLLCYPKISHRQLFDLQSDPDETTNLIDQQAHRDTVARLLALMQEEQRRYGDTQSVEFENKPFPPIDLSGKARMPDQWQPDWIVEKYFR
jgi:arylsulfatase A-like enzyme